MKTLAEYNGYNGIDASLETSLFEYGMIWAEGLEGHEKDFHFIYGVGMDELGNYNSFDWADIAIDCNIEKEYDWADFQKVADFCGITKEEFLKQSIPMMIFDLVSYYGRENIFGGCYNTFEIVT